MSSQMHAEFKRINNTGKTYVKITNCNQSGQLHSRGKNKIPELFTDGSMSKSYCLVSVGNKKSKFLNSSQLFNMKFFVVKDLNRATLHEVVV